MCNLTQANLSALNLISIWRPQVPTMEQHIIIGLIMLVKTCDWKTKIGIQHAVIPAFHYKDALVWILASITKMNSYLYCLPLQRCMYTNFQVAWLNIQNCRNTNTMKDTWFDASEKTSRVIHCQAMPGSSASYRYPICSNTHGSARRNKVMLCSRSHGRGQYI